MQIEINGHTHFLNGHIAEVFLKLVEFKGEGSTYYVVKRVVETYVANARIAHTDVFVYEKTPGQFSNGDKLHQSYAFVSARHGKEIIPENNKKASDLLSRDY